MVVLWSTLPSSATCRVESTTIGKTDLHIFLSRYISTYVLVQNWRIPLSSDQSVLWKEISSANSLMTDHLFSSWWNDSCSAHGSDPSFFDFGASCSGQINSPTHPISGVVMNDSITMIMTAWSTSMMSWLCDDVRDDMIAFFPRRSVASGGPRCRTCPRPAGGRRTRTRRWELALNTARHVK
jgi:hypothetical protein